MREQARGNEVVKMRVGYYVEPVTHTGFTGTRVLGNEEPCLFCREPGLTTAGNFAAMKSRVVCVDTAAPKGGNKIQSEKERKRKLLAILSIRINNNNNNNNKMVTYHITAASSWKPPYLVEIHLSLPLGAA